MLLATAGFVGDDEEATIRTFPDYRRAMVDLTQQYRGRVVDSPGDNLPTEFASLVNAVTAQHLKMRVKVLKSACNVPSRCLCFPQLVSHCRGTIRVYGKGHCSRFW